MSNMPEEIDWSLTTFEGNRLRQQRDFLALPVRRKLEIIEQMGEVAAFFAARRDSAARTATPATADGPQRDCDTHGGAGTQP
jgi:hypothetical protein